MYDKYQDILTGQSERDKEEFLKSDATLDQFRVRFFLIKESSETPEWVGGVAKRAEQRTKIRQ